MMPLCCKAMDTANCGKPCRKLVVPSGGAVDQIAGATRGFHRDVEHGVHNQYDLFNERPPHNYCACSYGVKKQLKILMYTKYIPVFRYFLPCLSCARYVVRRSLSLMSDRIRVVILVGIAF